ncbi:MAG: choice-of-anchor E domain-containing protein [Verrucomicrobiota bacterium]
MLLNGLWIHPGRSAMLIQSTNIPAQATDWSEVLNFDLLDPTTGMLNSITFTIEAALSGQVNLENMDPANNTVMYTYQASFEALRPGTNTVFLSVLPSLSGNEMLDPFDGALDFSGPSGAMIPLSVSLTNSLTTTNALDLALFQGVGTVGFDMNAIGLHAVVGEVGKLDPQMLIVSDGQAVVTLTYDFTPIPEPSTLAFVGLAVGVMALRRRFSARAAAD